MSAPSPPLVSVVMPVWNGERFLREAMQSVLAQSLAQLELVVVDDGSSDASLRIAQELAAADARVRVFRNERNLGIVQTRNRAFSEADPRSVYFAVMDSDDVCEPDRLALQLAFLEAHPDHAVVGGNCAIIDEHGRVVGRRVYPSSDAQIARVITRYNPIANSTSLIRRSALEQVGRYDERFPRCQDYDLWLRMAARFKVANLPAQTLRYRISPTQGKATHLRESLECTLRIQREWLLHPRFRSGFNLVYFALEHALLLLPGPLVLGLFKWLTYRRSRA